MVRLDLLRRSILTAIGATAWPSLLANAQAPAPKPVPPETPRFDAAATKLEATSIYLSWKPGPKANETVELEITGEHLGVSQTRVLGGPVSDITLADLSSCANYIARVRTIGEGGPSSWSDTIEVTTPILQPEPPFAYLLQVGGLPTVYRKLSFGSQRIGKNAIVQASLMRMRGGNAQVLIEHTASVESVIDAQYLPGDQYSIIAVGRTSSGSLTVHRSPPSTPTVPITATPQTTAAGAKIERPAAGLAAQFSFRRF